VQPYSAPAKKAPERLERCGEKSRLRPRYGVSRCLVGVVLGGGGADGREAGRARLPVVVFEVRDRVFRRFGWWFLC
jgi:hypothetical protein